MIFFFYKKPPTDWLYNQAMGGFWLKLAVGGRNISQSVGGVKSRWDVITTSELMGSDLLTIKIQIPLSNQR